MEKLRMTTADGVQDNVALIASLFPDCVTEIKDSNGNVRHAVDFDKLRQNLSGDVVEDPKERYQFTWPGKREAMHLANTPIRKTLRPCREESVGRDGTPGGFDSENLYIEGDNLDVLKCLREDYLGAVKMIYIDPPYNTGKDFVYNDKYAMKKEEFEKESGYTDEEGNKTVDPMVRNTEANGRFHTDWLNMMYPRLKVARDLLSDDGVIFISIDDNEVENLKKVCNEVFGEQNYVTSFSWVNSLKDELEIDTKFAGSNLGKIKKSHEYVLVYARNAFDMNLDFSSNPYIIKLITNGGNNIQRLTIPTGLKCTSSITETFYGHIGGNRDYYEIITPEGMIIENGVLKNEVIIEGPLRNPVMLTNFFRGETVIDNKGQKLVEVFISDKGMLHTKKERKGNTISSVLVGKGTTKNGTLLIKELFGDTVFEYAKPVELISYLISKHTDNDFIILDLFSGSATTAHAVLLSNLHENKRIKYILVQVEERIEPDKMADQSSKKIAQAALDYLERKNLPHSITELGKERIKLAAQKIKTENGLQAAGLDIGFRVLKLDSSNMRDVYYTPAETTSGNLLASVDNIKADRTGEDLLFQAMLELNIELSAPIRSERIGGKNVFVVDEGYLVAFFDDKVDEAAITEIAKKQPQYFVMRDASAASDNVLDNFEQIFRHYSPETVCRVL